jgi:hypothetical protein
MAAHLYCLFEVSVVLVIEGDESQATSAVRDLLASIIPPVCHRCSWNISQCSVIDALTVVMQDIGESKGQVGRLCRHRISCQFVYCGLD